MLRDCRCTPDYHLAESPRPDLGAQACPSGEPSGLQYQPSRRHLNRSDGRRACIHQQILKDREPLNRADGGTSLSGSGGSANNQAFEVTPY